MRLWLVGMGLGVGTVMGGTIGGKGHLSVTQVYPSTSAFCEYVSVLYMHVHLFEYASLAHAWKPSKVLSSPLKKLYCFARCLNMLPTFTLHVAESTGHKYHNWTFFMDKGLRYWGFIKMVSFFRLFPHKHLRSLKEKNFILNLNEAR